MWNLDNLDSSLCQKHIVSSWHNVPVDILATSEDGERIVTTNQPFSEARVFSLVTGDWETTIEHSTQTELNILEVIMSKYGTFCATRSYTDFEHIEDMPVTWKLLRDDKIWDLEGGGKMVYSVYSSRFVTFSPAEDKVVFTVCEEFDNNDRHSVRYHLEILPLNNGFEKVWTVALPPGEIIGEPVITESGKYFAVVLQTRKPLEQDGNQVDAANRWSSTLLVYSFEAMWHGLRYLHMPQLWNGYSADSGLVDIQLFRDDSLFCTFAQDYQCFQHHPDGQVNRARILKKGALIYDAGRDNVVRRLADFMAADSDLDQLVFSRDMSFVIDQSGRIFDTINNKLATHMSLSEYDKSNIVFLLDGRYIAMVTANRKEVVLKRCQDNKEITRFFTHSKIQRMKRAQNDRCLAISTSDGRLLTFLTTLGEPDHVTTLTNKFPSRQRLSLEELEKPWLSTDIFDTLKDDYLQSHFSNISREAKQQTLHRNLSYKSLLSAAQTSRSNSENCRVQ